MNDSFFVEEEVSNLPFDEADKVKTLNFIQQAIKKATEPLKDGVLYDGVLVGIEEKSINGTPTLEYKYQVNDFEITDLYFFSISSTDISVKRLIKNLKKFGFDLRMEHGANGLTSIVDYTKHLIGSEVKIIQSTRKDGDECYFNYEIVEVLKND